MSASIRAMVASAAFTADCAPTCAARAAWMAACAAFTCARAAFTAAWALRTRARSSSSSWMDEAPSLDKVSDRAKRLRAASSSLSRWTTTASAASLSLSRWAIWALALAALLMAC
ncbi:hypothetical protein D3C72_1670610 [compost metagenome]